MSRILPTAGDGAIPNDVWNFLSEQIKQNP